MLRRTTVLPVTPSRLWEELTDPEALPDWFGYEVEWELAPGAPATFSGGDDEIRHGRIEEVAPSRRLRFSWWPEDDESAATQVDYELEPDGGGTRLTVTETPEPALRVIGTGGSHDVIDLADRSALRRTVGPERSAGGVVRALAA